MSKPRRKRLAEGIDLKDREHELDNNRKDRDTKVIFMEQMDYKMEIQDEIDKKNLVILKYEEHTE